MKRSKEKLESLDIPFTFKESNVRPKYFPSGEFLRKFQGRQNFNLTKIL